MVLITNFVDTTTQGNTVLAQNLTVQGAFSTFSGNLLTVTSTTSIGNSASKFGNLFVTSANISSLNVTSIFGTAGFLGIGTTAPSGTTLFVAGNSYVTNSITTTNVYATTLNVPTFNLTSIFGTSSLVGVGTATPGSTLHVAGNVYASNALTTLNVYSQRLNVSSLANLLTAVVTSNVGIGTAPVAGGSTLLVQGNAYVSNALTTPVVFATASLNTVTANLTSLFGTAGLVGVGTATPGSTLHVQGNLYASNAILSPILVMNVMNVTGTTNILTLVVQSNVGIATTPVVGGPTLHVQGNAYVSNALTTGLSLFTTTLNTTTLNTMTLIATSNLGIGTTPVVGGPTLHVQGNAYVSNALTTPVVFATTSVNTVTANLTSIFGTSSLVGVGTATPGSTLHVQGNLYASNALTSPSVYSTNLNVSAVTNLFSVTVGSNVGIGTAPVAGGATLHVQGNAFVSNAITAKNVFTTVSLNTVTANLTSLFGTSSLVGVGTATPGSTLHVQGNLYASNALTTGTIYSTNLNVSAVTNLFSVTVGSNVGIGTVPVAGGATLQVQGNAYVSNALTTPVVFATTSLNTAVANLTSIFGTSSLVGVGTATPGSTLHVQGNLYASNALTTTNVFANLINVTTVNVSSLTITWNLGIGTTSQGSNLYVAGNAYVSNSLTTPVVLASVSLNTVTANLTSIFGPAGLVGVGTATPGSTLHVQGNIYASNALGTVGIYSTNANVLSVLSTMSVIASSNVGIGTAPGGWTLSVQGNASVSNSITTNNVIASLANTTTMNATFVTVTGTLQTLNLNSTNAITTNNVSAGTGNITTLNVTSLFGTSGLIGVGTGTPGSTLHVQGNLYVLNTITTANIFTTNINATTINTTTLSVGTLLAPVSTFVLSSNLVVSNAITTTNVFATNVTATSIYGTSGYVGVGTAPQTGTSLYVQGNIYVSNGLTVTNLVTGNLAYYEDLTKRAPYLLPTNDNAATIQNWITATTSASSKSWWATSQQPFTGNVSTGGLSGYSGSVLLPDGRVLFVPQTATNIGVFNSATGLFSTVNVPGLPTGFRGAVLTPNGNVTFVPYNSSNTVTINPVNYTFTNTAVGGPGATFQGGVLTPTGSVVFIPRASANVGVFNPVSLTYSNVGPVGSSGGSYGGGCLIPNGNIVMCNGPLSNLVQFNPVNSTWTNCGPLTTETQSAVVGPGGTVILVPFSGANVIVYNTSFLGNPLASGAFSNIPHSCGSAGFLGGCLLPSGNVLIPSSTTSVSNIGMVDPVNLTYSNSTSGINGIGATTLLPDGRVVFGPGTRTNVAVLNTMVPVDSAFCLSPFFNKF